ncbi:hypothetical protein BUALT_Bualt05G0019000 [Buddleja alternifolia]|uniref:Uncharacterized protein n=1 Tax=Buddleja alternifolia TaxID=168488 RepID=A0AAV6XMP2_9LAMI|nr:hypothetical protein BUALT_Bualt05G0019000 [Buddleja alternifolia]
MTKTQTRMDSNGRIEQIEHQLDEFMENTQRIESKMEQQRQEMMQEMRRLMATQMEEIVKNLINTKGKEPMHAQSPCLNIPSHSQVNENGHHSPSPAAGGIDPNIGDDS